MGLNLVIPFLPPSANNIYVTIWKRKQRILSKEAREFKNRFLQEVVPNYIREISTLKRYCMYGVLYRLWFPEDELINTTYSKKGGAKTWYKRMDIDNRIKLLSDCLSTATDIPDEHFFSVTGQKACINMLKAPHSVSPQIHISLWEEDPEMYGLQSPPLGPGDVTRTRSSRVLQTR